MCLVLVSEMQVKVCSRGFWQTFFFPNIGTGMASITLFPSSCLEHKCVIWSCGSHITTTEWHVMKVSLQKTDTFLTPRIWNWSRSTHLLPVKSAMWEKKSTLTCLSHCRWVFCFLQLNETLTDHTNQVTFEPLEFSSSYSLSVRSKVG